MPVPIHVVNRASFNRTAAFPDASSTGHTAWPGWSGSLTPYSGPDPIRAVGSNQIFEGYSFDGITVGAAADGPTDVTFRGCRFRSSWGDGWNIQVRDSVNIVFEYCTVEPAASQTPPIALNQAYQYGIDIRGTSSVIASRCNIYGFGNAFQIETSSAAFPVTVEYCYIHDAADQAGDTYHHDGFLSNNGGPQYVTLHGNTIFSGGNTNAIALQSVGTAYDHITISGNLLGGFGYTVNLADAFGGSNTDVTFEDNVFTTASPRPNFGPFKSPWPGTAAGCSWRRNRWRDDGGTDPSADGLFWLPTSGVVTDWSDVDAWVSLTDYTG